VKRPRILILNQNWLGDALFSTPALRALRKRHPDAFIACLAPARVSEALRRNPHLNEVLVYNERAMLVTLYEPLRILALLLARRFDTAFLFHRSRSKAFLMMLAGIRKRVGYARDGRDWLLTRAVAPPAGRLHKIDYFLHLLKSSGIPADGREPEMRPRPEEEASLEKLLASEGLAPGAPYAVLHPGGNWDLKRWPASYFIRWTRLFLEKNQDWKVVICGTKGEEALSRQIVGGAPSGKALSVCGRTTLGQLAALMKRSRLVLSNDSGPIHVAASQKARILGLYGPTSPCETGPVSAGPVRVLSKDVGCRVPCYFRACDHRVCMDLLTPEEAMEKTWELLAS
jgi:heptosyltransferase II